MGDIDVQFSSLYQEYYSKIKKLCLGYTHSDDEAEDLVQETFLSAWKHWNNFKGHSSRSTWIYRIAVNKCLSHIRKNVRKSSPLNGDYVDYSEVDNRSQEDIQLLYKAIDTLENIDKLIISMFLDEMTYKEISEILDIKENTIAVRIHRIKKQITELFNRYENI